MAASFTGTQQSFGSTSNSGTSAAFTVPADCNLLAIFAVGWTGAAVNMASMTWNGSALTLLQNITESGDADAVCLGVLVNPATGNQTFAWDWSGAAAIGDGALFLAAYIKDANTSDAVRDSDASASATGSLQTATLTLDSVATDFVFGVIGAYTGSGNPNPDGAPGGSGQTIKLDNQTSNNVTLDLTSEDTSGASTTTITGTGWYVSALALSLKASAGGAAGQPTMRRFGGVKHMNRIIGAEGVGVY